MGEFIHLPACNQVLSTYDVSHVMNFTRLSAFFCVFCSHAGEPGNEAMPAPGQKNLSEPAQACLLRNPCIAPFDLYCMWLPM